MQVRYVDEYGSGLFWGQTPQPIAPVIGDTVIIEQEEYRVKSRTFLPEEDVVVIELTQNQVRSAEPNEVGGRLKEMQRAIVEVNKRQELTDKRVKSLREQAMSVRQHIKRNELKPKEQI
jgi:hypothetical protein